MSMTTPGVDVSYACSSGSPEPGAFGGGQKRPGAGSDPGPQVVTMPGGGPARPKRGPPDPAPELASQVPFGEAGPPPDPPETVEGPPSSEVDSPATCVGSIDESTRFDPHAPVSG